MKIRFRHWGRNFDATPYYVRREYRRKSTSITSHKINASDKYLEFDSFEAMKIPLSNTHPNGHDEEEAPNETKEHHEESSWGNELQELRHRLEMLEQQNQQPSKGKDDRMEEVVGLLQDEAKIANQDDPNELDITKMNSTSTTEENDTFRFSRWGSIYEPMDRFEFPESTYSLLIEADILSLPFVSAMMSLGLSLICLVLTLYNSLQNREPGNPLGMPVGLPAEVRTAQYFGLIIGKCKWMNKR